MGAHDKEGKVVKKKQPRPNMDFTQRMDLDEQAAPHYASLFHDDSCLSYTDDATAIHNAAGNLVVKLCKRYPQYSPREIAALMSDGVAWGRTSRIMDLMIEKVKKPKPKKP